MIIESLQRVREFFQPRGAVLASGAFDPLHYGHIFATSVRRPSTPEHMTFPSWWR